MESNNINAFAPLQHLLSVFQAQKAVASSSSVVPSLPLQSLRTTTLQGRLGGVKPAESSSAQINVVVRRLLVVCLLGPFAFFAPLLELSTLKKGLRNWVYRLLVWSCLNAPCWVCAFVCFQPCVTTELLKSSHVRVVPKVCFFQKKKKRELYFLGGRFFPPSL